MDELGQFRALELRNRNPVFNRSNRPNLYYPIYTREGGGDVSLEKSEEFSIEIFPVNSKGEDGCWTWGKDKVQRETHNVFARLANTGAWRVFRKDRIEEGSIPTTKEKSIWLDNTINNENGKEIIGQMFSKVEVSFPKAPGLLEKVIAIGLPKTGLILDYFAGSGTTAHAIINSNRADEGKRRYILVEVGDYFDTILKPRIAKTAYAATWDAAKPVSHETGISHSFKYLRLESYEDCLNNLQLVRNEERDAALAAAPGLRGDYMLRYMLDVETRGSQSLLNLEAFADPTAYKLKVKRPGSDEYVEQSVDLIETFNYLLGLRVEHMAAPQRFTATFTRPVDQELPQDQRTRLQIDGRFRRDDAGAWWFRKIEGWLPRDPSQPDSDDQERVLIVWRKLTGDLEQDNLMLDEWFRANRINPRDWEFDTVYVNGSNNLPNLRQNDETWKVRLIEEEFMRRMWEVEDV